MSASELLSEEEKDAVMDTVSGKNGSVAGEEVQAAFDVVTREKFALAQMGALNKVNELFCMEFKAGLVEAFGTPVDVNLEDLEVLSIEDCTAGLMDGAVFNLVKINLASGTALLILERELLSGFINGFFGSRLNLKRAPAGIQPLSSSCGRTNQRVVQAFLDALAISWQDIAQIEAQNTSTEVNPDFVKFAEGEEFGVRFTFDVHVSDFTGVIQWILPYASLEPLSASSETAANDGADIEAWQAGLSDGLKEVELDVRAVLPEFKISLKQLKEFKVGSIVPLKSPEGAYLCIENIPFYFGEFGAYDDGKALCLKKRVELAGK